MDLTAGIGASLAAAGASMALVFIVLLVLGMVVLTLLYVGSAVVVLERFARVTRPGPGLVFFVVLVSFLAAVIWIQIAQPDLRAASGSAYGLGLGIAWAQVALVSALATFVCGFALLRVDPQRMANVVLGVLGAGVSLAASSFVSFLWLLAPLGGVLMLVLLLRWRRSRTGNESTLEAPLRWLAIAWIPGLAALSLPYEQQVVLATGGVILLAVALGLTLLGLLPLAAAGLAGMRRSVEWFIAVRYLVAKRRQVFISAISAICVGGIAAGVWLIIVVLSVMNGFERTWRDEILGNRAHFTVHSGLGSIEDYAAVLEGVRAVPGVTGASAYLDAEGMVRGEGGQIFSVRIRGIDPRTVGDVTDLRDDLIRGSIDTLRSPGSDPGTELPGIVIGNQLAMSAGVGVSDPLLLISPVGGPQTPLGPAPRLKKFLVVGIFESSFFQYDEVYTYTGIPDAQDFRRAGDIVDGIEARTTDFYRSQRVGLAVRKALGYPYYTRDWKEFFPAFFQALKSERIMMFLLLTMIMVVAAFLIVATLIMMIMEKSSDIAILKAMGAEDSAIERIFAIEGTLIGLMGTAIGVVAGIAVTGQLTWLQETIERITGIDTLPASVYQFSTLPSEVDPVQVGLVAGIAMILSLGATLLPIRQGARLDPAEGLRYE